MTTGTKRIVLSELYVNIEQAASVIHVDRMTIYRWMKQGKLNGQRIGGVRSEVLICKKDVLSIAQQRHTEAMDCAAQQK